MPTLSHRVGWQSLVMDALTHLELQEGDMLTPATLSRPDWFSKMKLPPSDTVCAGKKGN